MIFSLLAQQPQSIGTYRPPANVYQPGADSVSAGQTLNLFISNTIGFLTILGGILFMLFFFFAALQWATAGSDEGKVESSKKQMTNGAVGLIIIVLSYGIISIIGRIVGINILSPGCQIQYLLPGPITGIDLCSGQGL